MKRYAFTLVELLVVIAIIGILVGLLLPAVQAAREAARRMSCTNNLVQISLGTHHYEFSYEKLPAGVTDPNGPIQNKENAGQHIGWMLQILPYIEQHNAYESFDFDQSVYSAANEPVRHTQVSTFRCPSNPFTGSKLDANGFPVGLADYAGCQNDTESPIDSDDHGIFFRNSEVQFRDISDGTTQTILIGEHLGDADELGWVSGTRATLRNTGAFQDAPPWDRQGGNDPRKALDVGGFSSYHQGGANFGFADGSVMFLTHSIDTQLYSQLGHRADGILIQDW